MPPWFDVDDAEGLRVLSAQLALRPRMAPVTAAVLASLSSTVASSIRDRPTFDRERDA
jgi:hypothetical protein